MDVDGTLTYSCATSGHTHVVANVTLTTTHAVTCGADGQYAPAQWPTCAMHCPIPPAEATYATRTDLRPAAVDQSVDFECLEAGAKVGSTVSNVHSIICKVSWIVHGAFHLKVAFEHERNLILF